MVRALVLSATLLAGCAWQTDALQMGPNLYRTSANASPARGSTTGAQNLALKKANEKCASLGKTINVTDVETGTAYPANGTATVTFECD